jgi:23S rRNA (pseudouridine1915-N3)-methyltransferase
MKIKLYLIGKTKLQGIDQPLDNFIQRIRRYIGFEIIIIPDLKQAGALSPAMVKTKEAKVLLSKISANDFVVLLDENGKQYNSIDFAEFIEQHMLQSTTSLSFIIGGAFGFDNSVYQRANHKLSLSKMTFSHQLIRLIFAEQLYRAFSIIKNEPYHNA